MGVCSYCNAEETMPFTCKFCGSQFCADHRLPENHTCIGLEKFKENRSKAPEKWIYEPFHERHKKKAGREIKKPLRDRLSELVRGLDPEKIIYIILAVIGTILLVELIRIVL
ncbi:MAG: AN1-type zinc finger protein [Candidatus Hydrothermarchaeales archaeon]